MLMLASGSDVAVVPDGEPLRWSMGPPQDQPERAMHVEDLGRLYDYGYWANRRLFTAVSGLTPGQFTQVVAGSYGSIRNTLVHVLSAEWGWLERCGGPPRGDRLDPERYP